MNSWFRRVELLTNVAIIVAALLLSVVLVKRFVLKSDVRSEQAQQEAAAPSTLTGKKISLPDLDWSRSKRNLVLVLQKGCHFCTESAGFYQRLAQASAKHKEVQLIAALPQDVATGAEYLKSLGVATKEIRQVDFSTIGVRGTPTLLFVDSKGVVTDSWIGKLPPEKEQEVLSRL